MKLGAEPKKLAILIGLLVIAVVVLFTNSGTGGPDTPAPAPSAVAPERSSPATAGLPSPAAPPRREASRVRGGRRETREFRPSIGGRRPEDRADPLTIDPTLRLDLLTKLQSVQLEGPRRSVFEFGTAPPPPKTELAKVMAPKVKAPSPLIGPKPAPEPEKPPPPPPPPPIPLKFYGYANPTDRIKRAFFMEGEEIHIAAEGETVKRRYKVIRIGVNSAVVEDTEHKHQQTLPLEEQPG